MTYPKSCKMQALVYPETERLRVPSRQDAYQDKTPICSPFGGGYAENLLPQSGQGEDVEKHSNLVSP
jgi:hypothetical protein